MLKAFLYFVWFSFIRSFYRYCGIQFASDCFSISNCRFFLPHFKFDCSQVLLWTFERRFTASFQNFFAVAVNYERWNRLKPMIWIPESFIYDSIFSDCNLMPHFSWNLPKILSANIYCFLLASRKNITAEQWNLTVGVW